MAENLNFEIADSYCYNNDPKNAEIYGRLYTWEAAKKAVPNGWHLPSKAEYNALIKYYGGENETAAKRLINQHFGALFGGWRYPDGSEYNSMSSLGDFWSSSEYSTSYAWYMYIYNGSVYTNCTDKLGGASVRCVKN
jgi:uncharacterized protein (TIGR02145 family)